MMKQKSTQQSDEPESSGHPDKGIVKRSMLFFVLPGAIVCLGAIIFWGTKTFSPIASEQAFVDRATSQQKASLLLKKEMLGIAGELIGEFPSNERLRILVVEAHLVSNNHNRAKALLKEGIGLNPGYGEFYQRLAGIAFHHGQYPEAITFWKKTLEISPERSNLNVNIAESFMSSGKYRQAIEELQKYIKTSAESSHVYYLLGQGYLQLKKYEQSKKYFEKALEIRPNYPDANYGLATVYMRLKQRDKAQHYMKLFRQPKTERLSYKSDMAKKRDEVVVHDTSILELKILPETFTKLCIEGAGLYRNKNDLDKALTLLDKAEDTFARAIKFAPKAPDIYREFAFLYLVRNKKPVETIELAERAVSLKGSAKNYFILFSALYKNSDLSGALEALKMAIKLDPGNSNYKQAFDDINRNK